MTDDPSAEHDSPPSADEVTEVSIAEPGATASTDEPSTDAMAASSDPGGGFDALGLEPALLSALAELGYEEPTPIQREAIGPLLAGRDVLAEAPTGTGKTAAFALPALQRAAAPGADRGRDPTTLVLVPTRELAMQVAQAVHRYGRGVDARVLPVFGGQAIGQQLRGLQRGVDVVVATPGRALDLLTRGDLRLGSVGLVVLDEADEMLDMGFAEEMDAILAATPSARQTALFSATISPAIARIAGRHLRTPVRVAVAHQQRGADEPATVREVAYVVQRAHKLPALCRILDIEAPSSALVFGRTRGEVDELAEALSGRGYVAAALHGGLSQEARDRVMGRFRDGTVELLVATDVAARGLDIPAVSHVINYDVPSAPEAYVHRIGRTGRAGREGVAITLVEPREHRLLRDIERFTRKRLELARVPTVADLRERRLELLRATLREALMRDDFDGYRAVVEPLSDEFDLVDIALAALSLADPSTGRTEDAVEVPTARLPQPTPEPRARRGMQPPARPGDGRFGPGQRPRFDGAPFQAGPRRSFDQAPGRRFDQGPGQRFDGPARRFDRPGAPGEHGIARLYVGGGRRAGIRPADLVGAITNEAGVPGNAIGAIQVADSFALVEVPEDAADHIVRALDAATIRGRRFPVRRDRAEG